MLGPVMLISHLCKPLMRGTPLGLPLVGRTLPLIRLLVELADPPCIAAEAAPSERAPPVAQTSSEDSDGVSPSDDYRFTSGQQVNEELATEGSNGISDTQCVAAMSCASVDTVSDVVESVVTEVEQMIQEFVSDAANEGSDLQCAATEPQVSVVDGGDSGPGSQSILQAESSSAGVDCGTVSRQSPPSFSPLASLWHMDLES